MTFAGLALLEGGARIVELWWPPLPVDYGLGFSPESRVFVRDSNGRLGTAAEKADAFVTQHFAPEPEKPRVVVVGGSSVNRLSGQFRVLSDTLGLEVINAGGHSYGTHRLVAVVVEVLRYKPDVVVLYTGHNEFEEVRQQRLVHPWRGAVAKALSNLAVYRLTRDIWVTSRIQAMRGEPDPSAAWSHTFTDDEVEDRMTAFRENLTAMVTLCQQAGVSVILTTIPSDHVRPWLPAPARFNAAVQKYEAADWAGGYALARACLADTAGRHQSSDIENTIVMEVAQATGAPLVDIRAAVEAAEPHGVPGETLFADHCHLNEAGNTVWRKAITPALIDALAGR